MPIMDHAARVEFIEELGRSGRTITYGQLAVRFGLPTHGLNLKNNALSRIFDPLDRQDGAGKRPFRTAVIVRGKHPNMPGPGFFKALALHRGDPPILEHDRRAVWQNERDGLRAVAPSMHGEQPRAGR